MTSPVTVKSVVGSALTRFTKVPAALGDPGTTPAGYTVTVDDLVYDQFGAPLRTDGKFPTWGKHEATLGISATGFDWYNGARPGVTPPYPNSTFDPSITYTAHNVWGQVVPVRTGMPSAHRDVRLQFDLPDVYQLRSGAWVRTKEKADMGNLSGGYWQTVPSYSKVQSLTTSTYRAEGANSYSIDLKPTTLANGQPNYGQEVLHFFLTGFYPRIAITAGAQVAISTRYRLITDNPAVDPDQAKFVGCFSGDLFATTTTSIGANGRNPAFAMTRHKLITSEWTHVGHVTGTEAQIRGYPTPPFLV